MTLIDEVGYRIPDPNEFIAKYRGFCAVCHYSFFRGETVIKQGRKGFQHLNCSEAIRDERPRALDPKYLSILGKVNRKKLSELLSPSAAAQRQPAPRGGAASL